MIHLEREVFINREPEQVFDFVADGRNEPQYNSHVIHAEQTSPGPVGQGTQFRFEAKTPGRPQVVCYEITAYDRPRRIASRVTQSRMIDVETIEDFDAVDGGTRVRWSFDIRPKGAIKLLGPIIGRVLGRRLQSTFANLKALLEDGGSPRARADCAPTDGPGDK
jgi:uncharacterized protein YndB with AHSA1/START domain